MSRWNLPAAKQGFTYRPTLTGVLNIDALTLQGEALVQVTGKVVNVNVRVLVDTGAGGAYSFRCSLPVPAGQLVAASVIGHGAGPAALGFSGQVEGDPTSDEALCAATTSSGIGEVWTFNFSYLSQG